MQLHPIISVKSLPTGSSVTFQQSSYFSRNGPDAALPSPTEVLSRGAAADRWFKDRTHHPVVIYEALGLVVKFGKEPTVSIAERQCLWSIRRFLPRVPVPEIYGWKRHGDYTLLYMERVQGVTLEKRWDSLSRTERAGVCEQLRDIITELHRLRQDPNDRFLGGNISSI